MKVVIAGASGLIGSALTSALEAGGHEVRALVRRPATNPGEIAWDPAGRVLDARPLEGVDAVVNLAGENVGAGRWTPERRERILRSRVDATQTLVAAIARLERRPSVLVNASAVGFYGDRGEDRLTEASGVGHGFLPEVCLAWETHAAAVERLQVRAVMLRFGVVLARNGGALAKMLPLFRAGLGGRLGRGGQWMSWISLADTVGVIVRALNEPAWSGPFNVVAPTPVTNLEFTKTLGAVLGRPTIAPAPGWALRLAFGRMADEALLASTRALPARLQEHGYAFRHRTLEPALRDALTEA